MPFAVPHLGARLAASVANLFTRSSFPLSPFPALERGEGRGEGQTQTPTAGIATKASRAGPLIAFESLRRPVWTPRDYAAFANEGFMQNAIVYRCVRMIAECVATVPLLLYDGDQEIEDHPLIALVRRPNGHETYPDLMQRLVGFLLVSGNAYVEAVAVDDQVRELHVLRPDRMQLIPGPDGWPEAFDYTVGGRTVRISGEVAPGVRSVLHLKLFHPSNDHYGLSPLEAAASAIDLHNTAARWNKSLLDNSARPSGAIVYTARDGNLTSDQIERLKSELEAGFQGSTNAGRPLLLEGGLDWKAMSLSPKDMDFLEARHAAAREIALALGVPPMLLGIPGDNTYSNLAEAQRTFWRSTILPLVERIASGLSTWLTPAYDSRLELRPDLDNLPALAIEREALWASLEKTSFLTLNEKRAAAGFGPVQSEDEVKRHGANPAEKANFNPGQLRVPGGSGQESGRWASGDGASEDDADDAFLDLIGGKPLTPGSIRSLYRDFGGHHLIPLAQTILRSDVLSPDAVDVLSSRTVGGEGQLKDQRDADNPHRGRTAAHREYERGVRELTDRFIKDNGIDRNNPMTREQANRLIDAVRESNDSRVRGYLDAMDRYMGQQRGRRRFPRLRGGDRGQE